MMELKTIQLMLKHVDQILALGIDKTQLLKHLFLRFQPHIDTDADSLSLSDYLRSHVGDIGYNFSLLYQIASNVNQSSSTYLDVYEPFSTESLDRLKDFFTQVALETLSGEALDLDKIKLVLSLVEAIPGEGQAAQFSAHESVYLDDSNGYDFIDSFHSWFEAKKIWIESCELAMNFNHLKEACLNDQSLCARVICTSEYPESTQLDGSDLLINILVKALREKKITFNFSDKIEAILNTLVIIDRLLQTQPIVQNTETLEAFKIALRFKLIRLNAASKADVIAVDSSHDDQQDNLMAFEANGDLPVSEESSETKRVLTDLDGDVLVLEHALLNGLAGACTLDREPASKGKKRELSPNLTTSIGTMISVGSKGSAPELRLRLTKTVPGNKAVVTPPAKKTKPSQQYFPPKYEFQTPYRAIVEQLFNDSDTCGLVDALEAARYSRSGTLSALFFHLKSANIVVSKPSVGDMSQTTNIKFGQLFWMKMLNDMFDYRQVSGRISQHKLDQYKSVVDQLTSDTDRNNSLEVLADLFDYGLMAACYQGTALSQKIKRHLGWCLVSQEASLTIAHIVQKTKLAWNTYLGSSSATRSIGIFGEDTSFWTGSRGYDDFIKNQLGLQLKEVIQIVMSESNQSSGRSRSNARHNALPNLLKTIFSQGDGYTRCQGEFLSKSMGLIIACGSVDQTKYSILRVLLNKFESGSASLFKEKTVTEFANILTCWNEMVIEKRLNAAFIWPYEILTELPLVNSGNANNRIVITYSDITQQERQLAIALPVNKSAAKASIELLVRRMNDNLALYNTTCPKVWIKLSTKTPGARLFDGLQGACSSASSSSTAISTSSQHHSPVLASNSNIWQQTLPVHAIADPERSDGDDSMSDHGMTMTSARNEDS